MAIRRNVLALQAPLGWFTEGLNGNNYILDGKRVAYIPQSSIGGFIDSQNWKMQRKRVRMLCKATGDIEGGNLILLYQWQNKWDRCGVLLQAMVKFVFESFPKLRWAIFYDPILALENYERQQITWTGLSDLFVGESDFLYILSEHPQYWKSGKLPFVYIWACHSYKFDKVLDTANRDGWIAIADLFGSGYRKLPDSVVAAGFVSKLPGQSLSNYSNCVRSIERSAWDWSKHHAIIPAFSKYDDTAFNPLRPSVLTLKEGEYARGLERLLEIASDIDGERIVIGGTSDNWFEGSHVLPCEQRGRSTLQEISKLTWGEVQ